MRIFIVASDFNHFEKCINAVDEDIPIEYDGTGYAGLNSGGLLKR